MEEIHSSHRASSSKEIEARLLKSIARFDQGIATVNKKLRKVKFARRHTKVLIDEYEIRLKNENEDCVGVKVNAGIVERKLHDLDSKLDENRKNFEFDMKTLENLKSKIQGHTDQVLNNTLRINESSNEWEFANKLTTRICDISKQSAYLAYERWILLWPVIQLWLSSDSRVLSGIYSVAHLEGLSSEMMTHMEMKNGLQKFVESVPVYSDSDLRSQSARVHAEQKARSKSFDIMHLSLIKRCVGLIRSCENLKKDIDIREEFRQTLSRQLMDLSSCLDEDIIRTMSVAELQATKPLAAAAKDLKTRMGAREQVLEEQQGDATTNSGRFTAPNDMNSVLSSPVRTAKIVTPLRTLKNTEHNALAAGGSIKYDEGTTLSVDLAASASASESDGEYLQTGIGSYANKVGDTENSFDKKFEWYLKKFYYCKKSAAWQWCSWHSAASTQAILQSFPQLHIPSIIQREKTSGAHTNELAIVQALSNPNKTNSKNMSDNWDSFSVQQSMLSKALQDAFAAKKRKNLMNQRESDELESSRNGSDATFPRPPSTPRNHVGVRKPVHPLTSNSSLDSSDKERQGNSNDTRNPSEESDLVRLLVTKRDLSLLTAVSGRQIIRKVQNISTMITNTTVRKVSNMLEEAIEPPSSSLGANEFAESDDVTFGSARQDSGRVVASNLLRLSVEHQAQELNTQLSDSFAPCKEPLEKWISASIGEKYKDVSLMLDNLTKLLPRNDKPVLRQKQSLRTAEEEEDDYDSGRGSDSERNHKSQANSLKETLVLRPSSGTSREIVQNVLSLSDSLVQSIKQTVTQYDNDGGRGEMDGPFSHRDRNMPQLSQNQPQSTSAPGSSQNARSRQSSAPADAKAERRAATHSDQLLNCMETVIGGELYTVSLGWLGSKKQYLLSACTQMSKIGDERLTYKVYEISITSAVLQYVEHLSGSGSNHGAPLPLPDTPQTQRSGRGTTTLGTGTGFGMPRADSSKICQVLIAHLRVEQIAQRNYGLLIASMETSFHLTNPFLFSWQQQQQHGESAEGAAAGSMAANQKLNPVTKVAIHSPHVFEVEELLLKDGMGEDEEEEKRNAGSSSGKAGLRKDSSINSRGSDRRLDADADKGKDFPYILQVVTLRQSDGKLLAHSFASTYTLNIMD